VGFAARAASSKVRVVDEEGGLDGELGVLREPDDVRT
jgi:hypothetical protein